VSLREAGTTIAPYLREPALAYGVLGVLAAIVVLWWSPTPATRNPVTAIVLLALLARGFEGLRRRTAAEFPSADRADAVQSMRQGFTRLGSSTRARGGTRLGVGGDGVDERAGPQC
jgi:hypothetical protein